MKITLGTRALRLPVKVNRARPLIQNLGPGTVYLDTDETVTMGSGFEITPGSVYEFPTATAFNRGIYIVSTEDDTDVRVISLG